MNQVGIRRHIESAVRRIGRVTTEDKVTIAINQDITEKKELQTDKAARKSLAYDYNILSLTIDEFAKLMLLSYTWTAVFRNPIGKFHRKGINFKQADIFGIDIDNGETAKLTLDEALKNPFINKNAWLIYTSPSHKAEHNKFRIVFKFPETVFKKEILKCISINKFSFSNTTQP